MKNLKFGVFCLGLATAVGAAVAGLGAQDPSTRPSDSLRASPSTRPSDSLRASRPSVFTLDGRGPSTLLRAGSQLGVVVSNVDAKQGAGVRVDEVTGGGAADKAGLKAGDIVVEFDGERVRSARQFTRLVQETPDGRTVKIAVLRNGQKQTLEATPEVRSFTWDMAIDGDRIRREIERELQGVGSGSTDVFRMRSSRGRLGATVQGLSSDLAEYFGARDGGALVSSVSEGSAAEKAGLKAGDVITSVNSVRVDDADDLIRELAELKGDVSLGVIRDKKAISLKASLQ